MEELIRFFTRCEKWAKPACIFNVMALKKINEEYERECAWIRTDFLVRGICEKEVEGLLEQPSLFQSWYVPPPFRWEALLHADRDHIFSLLQLAVSRLPYKAFQPMESRAAGADLIWLFQAIDQPSFSYSLPELEQAYRFINRQ